MEEKPMAKKRSTKTTTTSAVVGLKPWLLAAGSGDDPVPCCAATQPCTDEITRGMREMVPALIAIDV